MVLELRKFCGTEIVLGVQKLLFLIYFLKYSMFFFDTVFCSRKYPIIPYETLLFRDLEVSLTI